MIVIVLNNYYAYKEEIHFINDFNRIVFPGMDRRL